MAFTVPASAGVMLTCLYHDRLMDSDDTTGGRLEPGDAMIALTSSFCASRASRVCGAELTSRHPETLR